MPLYNGHSITTADARIPSATREKQYRPITNEGVKIQDSYLSQGKNTIRIANRHVIITTLKQSLKFDLDVTCFDISLASRLLFVCSGKVVYVFNSETNILKNEVVDIDIDGEIRWSCSQV
jgi:hypothetical protein